ADWKTQIGDFITRMESQAGTPSGEYQSNMQFYEDTQKSIGGEVARVKAASGSQRAMEIMDLLAKDVENLRKLHESGGKGGLTQTLGEPARQAIETELGALNKLESEYRGGGSSEAPPANG
ncbi:MAG TPA: hypothetical protein VND93_05395, partial [Myxococcales bacterium]|nr:hypothetical protein [Myxococcales bacterium]